MVEGEGATDFADLSHILPENGTWFMATEIYVRNANNQHNVQNQAVVLSFIQTEKK